MRMKTDESNIAIIVPVRNEEGNIARLIESFAMSKINHSNIFIIEGNSSDKTFDELNLHNSKLEKRMKIMRQEFKGKFGATRTFLKNEDAHNFTHVFVWDGDLTIPIEDNLQLLELAQRNPEAFVTGSRFAAARRNKSMPVLNFIGNIFFSIAWSVLTISKPIDVLCGSKIVLISDLNNLPEKLLERDYYGDISMLFCARKNKRKVISVKIEYINRKYGTSNIQPISGGLRVLLSMIICARYLWHPEHS